MAVSLLFSSLLDVSSCLMAMMNLTNFNLTAAQASAEYAVFNNNGNFVNPDFNDFLNVMGQSFYYYDGSQT